MGGYGASPFLVGRGDELAVLDRALAGPRAGVPGAVLVGGEAGVGKSRLVREFTAAAEASEVRILVGNCLELSAEGLPFAPFSAMLRQLLREMGLDAVTELLPGTSQELGRLLPEFGEPAAEQHVSDTRVRLFEQVLALFERLAERAPTMLLIEDAHWADRSTRDLLAYLVRNLSRGVLLVVTYRSDELHRTHPLRSLIAELGHAEGVRRLDLPRLPRRAVAEQVRGIIGREPASALVDTVYERSEGNPLFVEALLDGDGTVSEELPESLRDLILTGVRKLPEDSQEVLRVASTGGTQTGHALLVTVTGLDDTALSQALRPTVAGNVLLVEGDAYVFRHALMREAIHDDLLPGEHARLHTRFAEILEDDPSLVPPGRAAAELAHHWHAARNATWALVGAWNAAEVADRAAAYTERLHMLARVLELWDEVADASVRIGADHIDVLEKATQACNLCGASKWGVKYATKALEELDTEGDPARATRLLKARGHLKVRLGRPNALADLREAARIAPTEPPGVERAHALAALARQLYLLPGGEPEARPIGEEALSLARELGDSLTEADTLMTLAAFESSNDDETHLATLGEAREIAERARSGTLLLRVAVNTSHVLEGRGEHERAAEVARDGVEEARRVGLARTSGAFVALNVIEPLIALGRWTEANGRVQEAHRLGLFSTPTMYA